MVEVLDVSKIVEELRPKQSLEDLVRSEVTEEIEQALKGVKLESEGLEEKVKEAPTPEDVETVKPVIEQDLEPEAYNHADYDITAYDGNNSYDTHYKPAEVQINESSASYAVATNEHKLKKESQEIQKRAKENNEFGRTEYMAHLDSHEKQVKESMKLRSIAMWQFMYANSSAEYN